MVGTLEQEGKHRVDITRALNTDQKQLQNATCIKAIQENRAVLIGLGKLVTISQLQKTPTYAQGNAKTGFGDRATTDYISGLYQEVQEHGMASLIKILRDALSCKCSRNYSFIETSFRTTSSAYTISNAVLFCFPLMYKDSVYLQKATRRTFQQIVAFSSLYGREKKKFDIVTIETSNDSIPSHD